MNRADFLMLLRHGLAGLPQSHIDDLVADYETHFAIGTADGRSESDVAAALGDPIRLARELRAEAGFQRWEQDRSAGNFLGVVLALLGLATIDLVFLFPFLCAMAGIFFGFAVACLALCVAGVFLLTGATPFGWHPDFANATVQSLAGVGLLTGGVGGGALLLLVIEWSARLLVRYARLHFRLLNSANNSI